VKADLTDYAGDLDRADSSGPILNVKDLAALLRMGSAESARTFAREHLQAARLEVFGTRWKFSRKKVLEILKLTDADSPPPT
jgi:hypothetical protein